MALRKRAMRHSKVRRLYLKPSLSPREGRPTVVQSVDWLAERDGRGWLQIVPLRSSRVVTIPEASIGPRPRGGARARRSLAWYRVGLMDVSAVGRCREPRGGSLAF